MHVLARYANLRYLIQVQKKTFLSPIQTPQDTALVHPSSVNWKKLYEMDANDGWLLYHRKMQTSNTYLFDTTLVNSMCLLLFGGSRAPKMQIVDHSLSGGATNSGGSSSKKIKPKATLTLDSKMTFHCDDAEAAVLIRILRREIDNLFMAKILNPQVRENYSH